MRIARRMRAASPRTPFGMVHIVALAALIAAPVAHAAPGGTVQGMSTDAGEPSPSPLQNAAFKPQIQGRVSDRNSLDGDGVHVRGIVTHAGGGPALVKLQVRRAGRHGWMSAGAAHVKDGSKFTLSWHGRRPGRFLARLVVRKNGQRATDRLGAVFVFRRSFASWYGPGFIGGRTACGGRLTESVLGVAHKTLPCGTRVTFHLRGRTVTARVIDRGPFAAGRDWDLTPALRRKLHFGSTGSVNTTS